ncbi:MAG: hypothetical protein O3B68_21710 [Planctomycetota bacterium]|nr:hypothetical protein [Planctomycetota bacterium]
MIRAIFFAGGLFVALCGTSFLMVDKMVLTASASKTEERTREFRGLFMEEEAQSDRKVFNPPEWAAFCLMSIGAVTMFYSVALPKRQ